MKDNLALHGRTARTQVTPKKGCNTRRPARALAPNEPKMRDLHHLDAKQQSDAVRAFNLGFDGATLEENADCGDNGITKTNYPTDLPGALSLVSLEM